MNRVTSPEEQLYHSSKPGPSQCCLVKRYNSPPPQNTESWVTKKGPRVRNGKLVRSISLASRRKGHHQGRSYRNEKFKPGPTTQESGGYTLPGVDSYDSDKEDRRSGVPIIFTQNQCVPIRASMKHALEAEFQRLEVCGQELTAILGRWKRHYEQLCESFSNTPALHRTASQLEELLYFEEACFNVQEELSTVEDEMGHIHAQMRLFLDHNPPPFSRVSWLQDGDSTAWVPEAVAEEQEQVKSDQYPVLEWNGVDYNAIGRSYSDFENSHG